MLRVQRCGSRVARSGSWVGKLYRWLLQFRPDRRTGSSTGGWTGEATVLADPAIDEKGLCAKLHMC